MTLTAAVGLARLFEARVMAQKKSQFSFDSKQKPFQPHNSYQASSSSRNNNPPIKRLSESERKERNNSRLGGIMITAFHLNTGRVQLVYVRIDILTIKKLRLRR
jgi:hypothetical protein